MGTEERAEVDAEVDDLVLFVVTGLVFLVVLGTLLGEDVLGTLGEEALGTLGEEVLLGEDALLGEEALGTLGEDALLGEEALGTLGGATLGTTFSTTGSVLITVALGEEVLGEDVLFLDVRGEVALFLDLRGEDARPDLCTELELNSLTGGGMSALTLEPLSLGGETGLTYPLLFLDLL